MMFISEIKEAVKCLLGRNNSIITYSKLNCVFINREIKQ